MRKDVECAFGILKTRFKILSIPIPLQSINAVDQIWKTCCALHNWLLKIDGLDGEWYGMVLDIMTMRVTQESLYNYNI